MDDNKVFIDAVIKLLYPGVRLEAAHQKLIMDSNFDESATIGTRTARNTPEDLFYLEDVMLHVVSGQNLLSVGSGNMLEEIRFPEILRPLLRETFFRKVEGERVGEILSDIPYDLAILVKHRIKESSDFNIKNFLVVSVAIPDR